MDDLKRKLSSLLFPAGVALAWLILMLLSWLELL
jgi:hypothetical protein